ncbi:MAG: hypothetical protein IKG98_05570 [Ruminococcus sp.]|nr:hypothetical protein [Ruminococcus sp.]
MKDEQIRDLVETETETERTVSYRTDKAFVTVHIPKHTPEEQAAYEKNVRAALRRFYYHVTVERGCDWDELVAASREGKECR